MRLRVGPGRLIAVPEQLVRAIEEDRLVVIAGAGVSVDSGVPLFWGLAEQLACRRPGPDEALDVFLGRVADEAVPTIEEAPRLSVAAAAFKERPTSVKRDLHTAARHIIEALGARHNKLHRHILRLFSGPESVRIVTTNFDLLFEAASREQWPGKFVPSFRYPALPRGSDFRGIVHPHGAVRGPASDLVLTDKDFAKAYLTEGWARRFLADLFDGDQVVLFVGYSGDDTIVRYLARAFSSQRSAGRRFALCRKHEAPNWPRLGVEPITFDAPNGDFRELRCLVAAGAQHQVDGPLGRARHVRRILAQHRAPESAGPSELDYVAIALGTANGAGAFLALDPEVAWINWAFDSGLFEDLFDQDGTALVDLAALIAAHATDGDLRRRLLRLGRAPNRVLWRQLASALLGRIEKTEPGIDEGAVADLVHLLFVHSPQDAWSEELIPALLRAVFEQRFSGPARLLVPIALSPRLVPRHLSEELEAAGAALAVPTLVLQLPIDTEHFQWVWEAAPVILPAIAADIEPLLFASLVSIANSSVALSSAEFDLAAEASRDVGEDDPDRDAVYKLSPLLRASRDTLNALVHAQPPGWRTRLDAWLRSQVDLVTRIGLVALASSNLLRREKLELLVREGYLRRPALRRECGSVAAECYRAPGLRTELLNHARACILGKRAHPSQDQARAWHRFLLSLEPQPRGAGKAELERLSLQYPSLRTNRSDADDQIGPFAPDSGPPVSELLSWTPDRWLAELTITSSRDSPWPPGMGLTTATTNAAKDHPEWALRLAGRLAAGGPMSSEGGSSPSCVGSSRPNSKRARRPTRPGLSSAAWETRTSTRRSSG
jgi:hypothetical protein